MNTSTSLQAALADRYLADRYRAGRFLREIQLAAKLSHPHILPLYDSGDADGALYYVMPNVQGQSLRDRLDAQRQLPMAEAVCIASEVASALVQTSRTKNRRPRTAQPREVQQLAVLHAEQCPERPLGGRCDEIQQNAA